MAQWKPPNCLFFFSFYQPVWFLTEQWLHLWSFISTAMKKELISLLILMQLWLESRNTKLLENKSDWTDVILSNCQLAQIPEKYLWTEFIYEARDLFNHLFLNLYFPFRGDTLRSYISEGICSIDLKFTGS